MTKHKDASRIGELFTAAAAVKIKTVDQSGGEGYRIRGIANSFGMMHSGTIIHPRALDDWLRENPSPRLKLYVNHGEGVEESDGFATIGVVDRIEVRNDGIHFEAKVIPGTQRSDEAIALLKGGGIDSVSLGWRTHKQDIKKFKITDSNLDPWVRERMRDSGATQAEVHRKIIPREISLVDMPDDPGALLAASAKSGSTGVSSVAEELFKAFDQRCSEFFEALRRDALLVVETVSDRRASEYGETLWRYTDPDATDVGCGHGDTYIASDPADASDAVLRLGNLFREAGRDE